LPLNRPARILPAFLLAALAIGQPGPALAQSAASPELPRLYMDTTYVVPAGQTIAVPAGGDFQAALNAAQPGDTIRLQAGATFTGAFTLPNKTGTGWIVVRSSAPDSALPPPGTRITPDYAGVLPKLVSPNASPVIGTAPGAHHYRFVGIEFTLAPGVTTIANLLRLGDWQTQTSLAQVPHDIVLDRVYIHGNATATVRRGIALNSAWTAVVDSHISDVHDAVFDSQAIAGWNGPGPFKLVNNHLEGSGENLMFGGGDPAIANLVPSDIEVRHNHFFKPLSWRPGDPSYAGRHWAVKNLLELKNAQRALIDGNIFENNWFDAQNGFAILFTVRNQDGQSPWSVVQDVTFTNNVLRHSGSGINILGLDDIHSPSGRTSRVLIRNNLFVDIDGARWGGLGRLFQLYNGTADVVVDHNTAFQTGEVIGADTTYESVPGQPHSGFVYRNNLSPHNQYGVAGRGTYGDPALTLGTYFPGAIFARNVLAGGDPSDYPPDNFFPASIADVGFTDLAGGDYRLAAGSPYGDAGTDGRDLGADIDRLELATAGVIEGIADTVVPTVSVTAPSPGATVGGAVQLAAEASDNAGVVGVQFTLDGADVGPELAAAPYVLSWDTAAAANGSHSIGAVAVDAAGNLAVSAGVPVTVANGPSDTAPPIISSVAASSITASAATITWTTDEASDSAVEYGPTTAYGSASADGSMTATHSRTLSGLAASTLYHYRVKSRDGAGNLATSGDSTFTTLASSPGSVSITAPVPGAVVSGKTVQVSATATASAGIASVQFKLDGANLKARDTSAPYGIRWDTTRSTNGAHTLTAVAKDKAGNIVVSAPVTVTVANAK
jgi:hypothetical protein